MKNERTVRYLKARFTDYYKQNKTPEIPKENKREFGFIPWKPVDDLPMFRHKSIIDYGSVNDFLTQTSPRHAYASAAKYMSPSTSEMNKKGWQGTDLVFDLDADHLEKVNEDTSYEDQLKYCKDELLQLLDTLMDDFGYEYDDLFVVFSGGRGYHVHIRDPLVQELDSKSRREIVDYIQGREVKLSDITYKKLQGQRQRRMLDVRTGWGRKVQQRLIDKLEDYDKLPKEEAIGHIMQYDNIGKKKASNIYSRLFSESESMEQGEIIVENEFKEFTRIILEESISKYSADIDEPVTTDIRRLIRIPGSLHGGSGLEVKPVPIAELEEFNPTRDAIPNTFSSGTVSVELVNDADVTIGNFSEKFEAGDTVNLPEYVAIYLMCSEVALKN